MMSAQTNIIHEDHDDSFLSLSAIDEISEQILDGGSKIEGGQLSKGQQQDIHDEGFKLLLKDFCHNYQIPFLENNI